MSALHRLTKACLLAAAVTALKMDRYQPLMTTSLLEDDRSVGARCRRAGKLTAKTTLVTALFGAAYVITNSVAKTDGYQAHKSMKDTSYAAHTDKIAWARELDDSVRASGLTHFRRISKAEGLERRIARTSGSTSGDDWTRHIRGSTKHLNDFESTGNYMPQGIAVAEEILSGFVTGALPDYFQCFTTIPAQALLTVFNATQTVVPHCAITANAVKNTEEDALEEAKEDELLKEHGKDALAKNRNIVAERAMKTRSTIFQKGGVLNKDQFLGLGETNHEKIARIEQICKNATDNVQGEHAWFNPVPVFSWDSDCPAKSNNACISNDRWIERWGLACVPKNECVRNAGVDSENLGFGLVQMFGTIGMALKSLYGDFQAEKTACDGFEGSPSMQMLELAGKRIFYSINISVGMRLLD